MTLETNLSDVVNKIDQSFYFDAATGEHSFDRQNENQIQIPAIPVSHLGSRAFQKRYNLKGPYVSGSMASGIASVEIVESIAKAGFLGFFGAAGLPIERVTTAIDRLQSSLADTTFGVNLIHSPQEPEMESQIVELFIQKGIKIIEASAFMGLTLPIIHYRASGFEQLSNGEVRCNHRVMAKISRVEVATKFMSPPPAEMLRQLVDTGKITPLQAELASKFPVADEVTAEADSGGHTDNRPALALIPSIVSLRNRLQAEYNYENTPLIGAAGGISTPESAAAAFSLGASYIVTGSVNQACREAGTSDTVKEMLAGTEQADVVMAPAADMFEMGVKVQVVKRGTMFAMRGNKLYELYKKYGNIDALPDNERTTLEKQFFKKPLAAAWQDCCDFFTKRDPNQIIKAEKDPRHKMALLFRAYLGQASKWATSGDASRKLDYQVWCGPAMGAFNEWTKGSFLEKASERHADVVAMNLLYGAAALKRREIMGAVGFETQNLAPLRPMQKTELEPYFN